MIALFISISEAGTDLQRNESGFRRADTVSTVDIAHGAGYSTHRCSFAYMRKSAARGPWRCYMIENCNPVINRNAHRPKSFTRSPHTFALARRSRLRSMRTRLLLPIHTVYDYIVMLKYGVVNVLYRRIHTNPSHKAASLARLSTVQCKTMTARRPPKTGGQ